MTLEFFFHSDFQLTREEKFKIYKWFESIGNHFSITFGHLYFNFHTDLQLLEINRIYLDHDYFTDIITFDYGKGNIISGDIHISVERVIENARVMALSFKEELHRVMVHGILHLIGFNDATDEEKMVMRQQENYCLSLLSEII